MLALRRNLGGEARAARQPEAASRTLAQVRYAVLNSEAAGRLKAYEAAKTTFQVDRGRCFSVIVDDLEGDTRK